MRPQIIKQVDNTLHTIRWMATRWSVATITVRRAVNAGELGSVAIRGVLLIPHAEVIRAETSGIGNSRKYQKNKQSVSK